MSDNERIIQNNDFEAIIFGSEWKIVKLPNPRISAVCIDLEKTLVVDPGWIRHIRQAEIDILSNLLGWTNPQTDFETARNEFAQKLGAPKVSVSYMAKSYGIKPLIWNRLKQELFIPEIFTFPEKEIVVPLVSLLASQDEMRLGIMTNTPQDIVKRIFKTMGVDNEQIDNIVMFSADNVGVAKPDYPFFETVISTFQVPTTEILIVGDDAYKDLREPFRLGMGAAHATGPHQTHEVVEFLQAYGLF